MSSLFRLRHAVLGAGLLLCLASSAGAQSYGNPNLPRSPYALPEPTYREPDIDALANGNGKLHFSGQWRHWGDSRNGGELFQQLLAPNGVVDVGPRTRNGLPSSRSCAYHPDAC